MTFAEQDLKFCKEHQHERAYMVEASVYHDAYIGDCTNNGISSRFTRLHVYSDFISEEAARLDAKERNLNLLQCVRVNMKKVFGHLYYNLRPLAPELSDKWCMNGGNFAYTCDSRWEEVTGNNYPLPIHDRIED